MSLTTRRFRPLRGVAFVIAVMLAVGACGDGQGDEPAVELPVIGTDASIAIGASSDVPRVVNLWATWCAPCRRELPEFTAIADQSRGEIEVLGVNIGEDEASAQELIHELELGFTQLLDLDSQLSARFEVKQMPTTVFLRADGSLAGSRSGALDRDGIVALVDEFLGIDLG